MIGLIAALLTPLTLAAACPDLTGTYLAQEDDGLPSEISLRQTGCRSIEFTHTVRAPAGEPEVTRETWTLDGRCRSTQEAPELCISRAFKGATLVTRGLIRIAGQTTSIPRFEQKLRLEPSASKKVLVSDAVIYRLSGAIGGDLEERQIMRYTSAEAPSRDTSAQKGKAPVPVDASKVSGPQTRRP